MYHITRHVARRVWSFVRDQSDAVVGPSMSMAAFWASERRQVFYWTPVLVGLGIALYFSLTFEPAPGVIFAGGGTALILLTLAMRNGRHLALVGISCILTGFCLAGLRTIMVDAPVLPAEIGPAELHGDVLNVELRVRDHRLVIKPAAFAGLNHADLPRKIRITVRTRGEMPLAGQTIKVRSVLRPPPSPVEPGAFDFQRHLFFQRIGAVGYAVGPVRIVDNSVSSAPVARLRNALAHRIGDALPGQAGALAAALLVGDRGKVDQKSLQALRDAGLAHLLAISGLHVGLVAGFIFFALRSGLACWPRVAVVHPIKKYAALAATLGAGAYLILAGGSIPTQRAFIVVLIGMVAVLLDRRAISLRVVAVAALIVLIISPEALTGASFQMSFAAVLGLVAAYEVFGDRLLHQAGTGPAKKVMIYMAGILATTIIASLATAPFAIHHFNRVADYGALANLAAMPVMAFWVMPVGVVSMLAATVGLEYWPLAVMGWGIDFILFVATHVSAWPGAVRLVSTGPDWAFLVTIGGALWLVLIRHHWRLFGLVPIVVGLAGPLIATPPDIRISEDGKLIGVRAADGGLILSSEKRQKFAARQWLRRDGLGAATQAWPAQGQTADGVLQCDSAGCVWRRAGRRIALPMTMAALADDCSLADAVIATIPRGQFCRGRSIPVRDYFDFWRDGAISVHLLSGGQIKIQSVNGVRGARPWVWRPTPIRDQFWRDGAG